MKKVHFFAVLSATSILLNSHTSFAEVAPSKGNSPSTTEEGGAGAVIPDKNTSGVQQDKPADQPAEVATVSSGVQQDKSAEPPAEVATVSLGVEQDKPTDQPTEVATASSSGEQDKSTDQQAEIVTDSPGVEQGKPTDQPAEIATVSLEAEPKTDTSPAQGQETSSHFTGAQQQELRQIVKEIAQDVLKNNPDLLVQTIQTYGEEQQKKAMEVELKRIYGFKDQLLDDNSAFVIGKGDGRVKVVAFVDPNCPHCNTFEENINDVKSQFNELKIYIRPWAILGKPSEEVVKAMAYLKQYAPEKYEAISKGMISAGAKDRNVDGKTFLEVAKSNGIDVKKLQSNSLKNEADKFIQVNRELASEKKLSLGGTPAVFLFNGDELQVITDIRKEGLAKILQKTLDNNKV